MATSVPLSDLVNDLRFYARIQDSENLKDSSDLNRIVKNAASRHNSSFTLTDSTSNIPQKEKNVVLLLAWVLLMRVRASRFAMEANTSQGGFGTDRNTPYHKCMDMAKELERQYKEECLSLGLESYYGSSNNVVSSVVTCESLDLGAQTPIENSAPPPAIVLSTDAAVAPDGTIVVRWTQDFFENFYSYCVFTIAGADPIFQDWNFGGSYPGINGFSSASNPINDQTIKAVKLTGIPFAALAVNRFLVTCSSKSGKYSYSNEVVVTQPA